MDKANELVARGADRHKQGRLAEAESHYRRALRLNPNHADALNLLGLVLRGRGALREGMEYSARAVALMPHHPLMLANHGAALAEAGRLPEGIAAMQAALAQAPTDAVTWRNLGLALAALGDPEAALEPLLTATQLAPDAPEAWLALAHARHEAADTPGARQAAGRALAQALAGRNKAMVEQARFILAALGEGAAPDRAPAGYVKQLFDQFAPRFDAELEGKLHYRTPALLADALRAAGVPDNGLHLVLDLGCGTGLSGLALAAFARRLDGVDLSPRMLDAARARGIYTALHEADLLDFLPRRRATWDIIAAADVLNYLGDLAPALAAMRVALRPGGIVAFSLETPGVTGLGLEISGTAGLGQNAGAEPPFILAEGMRYRHAAAHVRKLVEAAGFALVSETPVVLREERGAPVHGVLMVLR